MRRLYSLLLLIAVSTAFTLSCSDSESRMPMAGTSFVTIHLGLPPAFAADNSLIDRALRFFAREAVAAEDPPAIFSSITVRVSGADIGVIEQTFPPASSVSMSVPAGSLRVIEVIATVAPYNSDIIGTGSPAESFRGVTRVNLPAGATVSVPVLMKLDSSKIIVPDYYNNQLVVMKNMGEVLTYLNYVYISPSWVALSYPADVDFDSRGRIYIAQGNAIFRCDDVSGNNGILVYSISAQNIAVDRNNDFVYIANGTTILRRNLDGTAPSSLPATVPVGSIISINGLEVAPDGDLLVSGLDGFSYNWGIFKIDGHESAAGIVASYTNTDLMPNPYDIKSQGAAIYVLNPRGLPDMTLLQFASGPGTFALTGSGPLPANGSFTNAGHFSSVRSDGLVIMDKPFVPTNSVIVFVLNAAGFGWATYTDASLNFYDYAGGG
jgi:hypothetical protein